MNSLRSFPLDLWSARALQLAVALCALLIAACGGGGYGGGGGGGMGGMSTSAPMITAQPMSQTVTAPAAATFSVMASSPAGYGLSYQWMRGMSGSMSDIMGATQASYTLPQTSMTDNGAMFQVKVINAYGTTTSSAAKLTVM